MGESIVTSILREKALEDLVGKSAPFLNLINKLKRVADLNISVLLTGETGVGKTRCAEFLHHYSSRRTGPFIVCNCGACPEALFESQIFGHVRGAFTGAHQDRAGLVAEANNGTLVLDEINSLNFDSQVKLNQFLETGCYRRVGENKIRQANVRIISITNKNLCEEIENGHFRDDLYYRLIEYEIYIPSLQSRGNDITLLIEHFCNKYSDLSKFQRISFSPAAMSGLREYSWPGNIRELEFFVKRSLIDANDSVIAATNLLLEKNGATSNQEHIKHQALKWKEAKKRIIEQFEKDYIHTLLEKHGGIVAHCASHAGMHTSDFWRLMRKYDVKAESYR